jgi:hypothetical protein
LAINADDQKSIIVSSSAAGDPRNGLTSKPRPTISMSSLPFLSSFLVKYSDEFSSLGAGFALMRGYLQLFAAS